MRPQRIARIALASTIATASGCFGAYAYPTVACTPPVKVRAKCEEIHAFRVDIRDQSGCIDFEHRDSYLLTPVRVLAGDLLGPQARVAFDHGWVLNCVALSYDRHTRSTVKLRVYRPGYKTVELAAWDTKHSIEWEIAEGIDAEEHAVDALVTTTPTMDCWVQAQLARQENGEAGASSPRGPGLLSSLVPGRAARGHREAMLFTAREYERLREAVPAEAESQARRDRLQAKAAALRALAER